MVDYLTYYRGLVTEPLRSLSVRPDAEAIRIMESLFIDGAAIWERFRPALTLPQGPLLGVSLYRTERSRTVNTSDRHSVSIFEAAGGEGAFLRLAAAHHQRCLADPVLNHPFSHPGHPQHIERLAAYWAEVFGGPPAYTQETGGHSAMLDVHASTQADAGLGSRFLGCFVGAFDDAGLPTDTELRAALRAYMEWAVADVMRYAPADAVVPAGRPVPRWTRGGLQADPGR